MTKTREIYCPICSKWFQSLGYARHRAMHYDQRMREKNINKSLIDFQNNMQKIINNPKNGCTSISISSPLFNNGEEIILAKKTHDIKMEKK